MHITKTLTFIASELDVSKIMNHFNMNQHEKMKNPVYDPKKIDSVMTTFR